MVSSADQIVIEADWSSEPERPLCPVDPQTTNALMYKEEEATQLHR